MNPSTATSIDFSRTWGLPLLLVYSSVMTMALWSDGLGLASHAEVENVLAWSHGNWQNQTVIAVLVGKFFSLLPLPPLLLYRMVNLLMLCLGITLAFLHMARLWHHRRAFIIIALFISLPWFMWTAAGGFPLGLIVFLLALGFRGRLSPSPAIQFGAWLCFMVTAALDAVAWVAVLTMALLHLYQGQRSWGASLFMAFPLMWTPLYGFVDRSDMCLNSLQSLPVMLRGLFALFWVAPALCLLGLFSIKKWSRPTVISAGLALLVLTGVFLCFNFYSQAPRLALVLAFILCWAVSPYLRSLRIVLALMFAQSVLIFNHADVYQSSWGQPMEHLARKCSHLSEPILVVGSQNPVFADDAKRLALFLGRQDQVWGERAAWQIENPLTQSEIASFVDRAGMLSFAYEQGVKAAIHPMKPPGFKFRSADRVADRVVGIHDDYGAFYRDFAWPESWRPSGLRLQIWDPDFFQKAQLFDLPYIDSEKGYEFYVHTNITDRGEILIDPRAWVGAGNQREVFSSWKNRFIRIEAYKSRWALLKQGDWSFFLKSLW